MDMDSNEKKKKAITIVREVRVHSLTLTRPQPPEYIQVGYQTIDTPQQFNGTLIVTKEDIKIMNMTVGDILKLEIAVIS